VERRDEGESFDWRDELGVRGKHDDGDERTTLRWYGVVGVWLTTWRSGMWRTQVWLTSDDPIQIHCIDSFSYIRSCLASVHLSLGARYISLSGASSRIESYGVD
jgi:hypothetical protein